jgi:hypothetical protein
VGHHARRPARLPVLTGAVSADSVLLSGTIISAGAAGWEARPGRRTTMTSPSFTPDVEQATERVRELSERMIEQARQSGLSWLEAYEKVLGSMLRLQQQAAQGTNVEWVATLAGTQADFVREMSKVYLDTVRQQLK